MISMKTSVMETMLNSHLKSNSDVISRLTLLYQFRTFNYGLEETVYKIYCKENSLANEDYLKIKMPLLKL